MSYHVNLDIKKLRIRIPANKIQEAVKFADGEELFIAGDDELKICPPEEEAIALGPKPVITKKTFKHEPFGGNHNYFGDLLEKLAVKFGGDYIAIATGEDGQVYPTKVEKGVAKKVKIQMVEV